MQDTTLGIATVYLTEAQAIALNLELRERYFQLMREHTDPTLKPYSLALLFVPRGGETT